VTGVDRRTFVRLAGGALAGACLPACSDEPRYTDEDRAVLSDQKRAERERSGRGPLGKHVYRGYRGLAELPWFELDSQGRLVMVDDAVPAAIDFHAHFGISLLFAPDIDLQARPERVRHLLDCDGEEPGCPLDLDVYINANFRDEDLSKLRRGAVAQGTIGSAAAKTHTMPALLQEMDDMNVGQAVILPIAFGLPFGDDLAERWLDAIESSQESARFVPGASVVPGDPDAIEKLRGYAARGARVVKLHPTMQRFAPDAPEAMEIYAECGRLGLPILFHAGRAGIEPESSHGFAVARHYEPMLAEFPDVDFILGHAGARDVERMLPIAKRHPNAWLEIHGQGLTTLGTLLAELGPERLLFGTDWPFYHLGATLAKVLLVTQERPDARQAILRDNALRLLQRS
jgi:predicted TIM-barrel fold metal-dependent hydrolase